MTLADDIAQDLSQRIRDRRAKPEQLTLAALAAEYGVSAMPIRQALEQLEDKGLVLRQANGRLTAARSLPKRKAPRKSSSRTSTTRAASPSYGSSPAWPAPRG